MFANKVNSKGNNDDSFYSHEEVLDKDKSQPLKFKKSINQKINDIFNSSNYIYKADVLIKFKDGEVTKRIVGKNSKNLITMDNELIPISDIIDIKTK